VTNRRSYTPRVPAAVCPHCLTRSIACDSFEIDRLPRDIRHICQNAKCGHVIVPRLCIFRIMRPSMIPEPAIRLPYGQWRSKPANDDNHLPANDDHRVPANDDHPPDAAEVAIPRLIP